MRQPPYHVRTHVYRHSAWLRHRPTVNSEQITVYHTYYDCPTGRMGISHGDAYVGIARGAGSHLCALCAAKESTGRFPSEGSAPGRCDPAP